jgi:hypothetical protein
VELTPTTKKGGKSMSKYRTSGVVLLLAIGIAAGPPAFSQGNPFEPNLTNVAAGKDVKILNRTASAMDKEGRPAIRFDERPGDGLALWPEVEFSDGIIDFDARGKDVVQQSFIGVAFHGSGEAFDAIYFRPFNFRASDPVRRNHAVQYVSNPAYDWERLRKEYPEKYEKPVVPPLDPNGWFHARIVVAYPKVSVFVNDAAQPSLVVEQLSDRKAGWVGLWVGNGSGGEFANLKISSVAFRKTFFSLESKPIPDLEPDVTKHFRAMIQDALNGTMRSDDYTADLWKQLFPVQKEIQSDLQNKQGELISLLLIDRQVEGGRRSYHYRLEFKKARAVEHFVLDEHNKVALMQPEGGEVKPEAQSADK